MDKVVITGVSTGIGYDATRFLIAQGYFVYGTVRSSQDAQRLESDFPEHFKALQLDVTNESAINAATELVQSELENQALTALINNAGIAVPGPIKYLSTEDLQHQLDVNVLGVHRITNAFAPLIGATKDFKFKPGKIINISSVSGLFSSPFTGAYCISKYALESMTDIYRREFLMYNVDVVGIQPGPIKTEIWNKVSVEALRAKYPDTDYDFMLDKVDSMLHKAVKSALPVSDISKLIYKILQSSSPKSKYLVHPNKFQFKLMQSVIPDKVIDRWIGKSLFGKNKKDKNVRSIVRVIFGMAS